MVFDPKTCPTVRSRFEISNSAVNGFPDRNAGSSTLSFRFYTNRRPGGEVCIQPWWEYHWEPYSTDWFLNALLFDAPLAKQPSSFQLNVVVEFNDEIVLAVPVAREYFILIAVGVTETVETTGKQDSAASECAEVLTTIHIIPIFDCNALFMNVSPQYGWGI
jgi:hypothetical protein